MLLLLQCVSIFSSGFLIQEQPREYRWKCMVSTSKWTDLGPGTGPVVTAAPWGPGGSWSSHLHCWVRSCSQPPGDKGFPWAPPGERAGLILSAVGSGSCPVLSQNRIQVVFSWYHGGFIPAHWPMHQDLRDCTCLARGNHGRSLWPIMGSGWGLALQRLLRAFLRATLQTTAAQQNHEIFVTWSLLPWNCSNDVLVLTDACISGTRLCLSIFIIHIYY